MKTIFTLLILLVSITSCHKRECEEANKLVETRSYELETAAYNDIIYHTSESHNQLTYAKQNYEQAIMKRDNYCN